MAAGIYRWTSDRSSAPYVSFGNGSAMRVSAVGWAYPSIEETLDGTDFEDTIRDAISLFGDADTLACIAGGIAHAFYGSVPEELGDAALRAVPTALRPVWDRFRSRYLSGLPAP